MSEHDNQQDDEVFNVNHPLLQDKDLAPDEFRTVELYGGAFTIDYPNRFVDISHYRPIPDHQEVYIDPDRDQSIIIELNSYQDVPDTAAIGVHWKDLMSDSSSDAAQIEEQGELTQYTLSDPAVNQYVAYIGFADGTAHVGKYKEEALNTIRTYIVNLRMKCVTTDVLIIFNIPLDIDDTSAAAAVVGSSTGGTASTAGGEKKQEMTRNECDKMIEKVVRSFKIQRMDIFPEMQWKADVDCIIK